MTSRKRLINKALEKLNYYRGLHGCDKLALDSKLSQQATEWAEHLSSIHLLKTSNVKSESDEYLGENLLRINLKVDDADKLGGDDIIKIWYDEHKKYDYSEQFSPGTSNFTQLIWKNTEKIGIGFSDNDDEHLYVVALFYPAGNHGNQFQENVLPSIEENKSDKVETKEKPTTEPEKKPEPAPAPAPAPKPKPETPQERFIRECLEAHNYYRRKHSVPELEHNQNLSNIAQNYANYLASRNMLKHSDCNYNGDRMGENLAMIMDSRLSNYPGDRATAQWYDEIEYHNFNGEFSSATGHFTQVVWRSSKEVGFGVAQSYNGSFYAVANYYPAGNMMGDFRNNVNRPMS